MRLRGEGGTRRPARRRLLGALLVSGVLVGSAAIIVVVLAVPGARWRASAIALKIRGELPDVGWRELVDMLRPGGPFHLEPIGSVRNLYAVVRNPYASPADTAAGAEVFRARCAICHGANGLGASGPSLRRSPLRHGDSDWALYRTISRGLPGTAMPRHDLPSRTIWQVIAFLRSLALAGQTAGTQSVADLPAVTYRRLRTAAEDPAHWLTYSGTYSSHRHSRLSEINRDNVARLRLRWAVQMATPDQLVESTPLVNGDVVYLTEPPSNLLALSAGSGRVLWSYERTLPDGLLACCERVGRGAALLEDRVYLGTLDAHLVALDARTGAVAWDVTVADAASGYSITSAPLAIDGKIIVGVAGGEFGIRGFLDAYDAATGDRRWRFHTVPAPREPGHETWSGESWRTGGAPTWLTGSFDPGLNLLYWGVGNPAPTFHREARAGDNLYSNSVIALNADTGELVWHFQFTPGDDHDWDSNQIPVLVDAEARGQRRRLLLFANRNGFYYVLDRATGEMLLARSFARQTWASGIDARGRPHLRPEVALSEKGTMTWPGVAGATNWWSPTYSPQTDLFYVPTIERPGIFFKGPRPVYERGQFLLGGASQSVTSAPHWTAVRALVPATGAVQWEYRRPPRTTWAAMGGLLSTAANLVFGGDDTVFFALDAETGRELWTISLGGRIHASPVTYLNRGRQTLAVAAGRSLFAFDLDSPPTRRAGTFSAEQGAQP